MGFISSFLGRVAGEAVNEAAGAVKQKMAEKQAAEEARKVVIESMIGKKIKLRSYKITKWWDSNGKMSTQVDTQMKDRNWIIKGVANNNRCKLLHAPSQTVIYVLTTDIV